MKFCDLIKDLKKRTGNTYVKMAKNAGLTPQKLNGYVKCNNKPSWETAVKIIEANGYEVKICLK